MPTMISRKLARNGMRQPHDIRSSRGSRGTSANAPAASRLPTETPSAAKLPQKPRCCGAVEEEVVPFARGPNAGREDYAQARTAGAIGCHLRHDFPHFDFLSLIWICSCSL